MCIICFGLTKGCNFNSEEFCIKYKKNRILSIIPLIANSNPPGYKEHEIYLITFSFGEGVTIMFFFLAGKHEAFMFQILWNHIKTPSLFL